MTLRKFIILNLLANLYLEGLHKGVKIWTTYPGGQGAQNPLVDKLLDTAAKLFSTKLRPDLIRRHTPVKASHRLRMEHKDAPFSLQTDSILINADSTARKAIVGKNVIVFDDFMTRGNASEAARNFLMQMGAAKVICVAIGKYGDSFNVQTPPANTKWDASKPAPGLTFTETHVGRASNRACWAGSETPTWNSTASGRGSLVRHDPLLPVLTRTGRGWLDEPSKL
jgi:hypothetical protein